jgi:putative transcriptional regulator
MDRESYGYSAGHDGFVEPLTGHLLISNSNLFDPNFRRTVVLIGHHDDDGAVGVVLNQPLGITVREAVPPLEGLVDPEEQLFDGGPVEPASVVVLADFLDIARAEVLAMDSIGFLPPEAGDDIGEAIRRARVYAGYAGWGPGQLEAELDEDSWVTAPALPGDVFHEEPGRLWEDVLRRLGPRYEMLRLMPRDPSMN